MGLFGAKDKKKDELQRGGKVRFCELCGALVNARESKKFCRLCMDSRHMSDSIEIPAYEEGRRS